MPVYWIWQPCCKVWKRNTFGILFGEQWSPVLMLKVQLEGSDFILWATSQSMWTSKRMLYWHGFFVLPPKDSSIFLTHFHELECAVGDGVEMRGRFVASFVSVVISHDLRVDHEPLVRVDADAKKTRVRVNLQHVVPDWEWYRVSTIPNIVFSWLANVT